MRYYHSSYGWIDNPKEKIIDYGISCTNVGLDSSPSINEAHNFAGFGSRVPKYDFNNGVDTGERHTLLRSEATDITEVDSRIEEVSKEIDEELSKINKVINQKRNEN